MAFLNPSYSSTTVALSVLIASFASFVALDLIRHVRSADPVVANRWLIGGSLAFAAGIWAMHFTGMQAFRLPIAIGYGKLLTAVSFLAAFVVSAIALSTAARGPLRIGRLAAASLLMGGGICTMHYTGMAAIDIAPGIVWRWSLVGASALIAVGASAAALVVFSWLPTIDERHRLPGQCAASLLMGVAISGMHYTGMAAALFPADAVCTTLGTLQGSKLTHMAYAVSLVLLSATWLTSLIDHIMRRDAAALSASLATVHDQLASADHAIRLSESLDPLTTLMNRVAFEQSLTAAVARADLAAMHGQIQGQVERRAERPTQPPRPIAVLFANITGLRTINDALGHAAGDEVIRRVARGISEQVRHGDLVARFGGDRFLVLMDGIDGPDDCERIAERITAMIDAPFEVAGRMVRAGVSVGIAVRAGVDASQDLIAESNAAMEASKLLGSSRYAFFAAHMQKKVSDEFALVADLRQAIDFDQLELHYQPKIDSRSRDISGVEALLRWTHPARGSVSPAVFIPLAERFGLIHMLGNWVIEQACRQIGEWASSDVHLRVAINLSVHQLRDDGLVARIRTTLQRHGVDPSQLLCEITESVAMQDIEATQRTLAGLGAIGIFLSIDDFGTGYSSLSYLRQLPAKQLKIDRSFVHDIEHSGDARALVDAVIHLAHALGLDVVAEGVETGAQRDILVRLGCDELQGFLFARPMSAKKLLEWTAGKKPAGALDFSKSLVFDAL